MGIRSKEQAKSAASKEGREGLLDGIRKRFGDLSGVMNERIRRLAAASEAKTLGARSISAVSAATGVSRKTIAKGISELPNMSSQAFACL